jgi:hypothetical protein
MAWPSAPPGWMTVPVSLFPGKLGTDLLYIFLPPTSSQSDRPTVRQMALRLQAQAPSARQVVGDLLTVDSD